MYSQCRIVGCSRPTTAGTRSGLNRLYCRRHEDHFERHGSHTKASYRAEVLTPYRKTAQAWLEMNTDNPVVQHASASIEALYRNAGPRVEAFRLAGLAPEQKACAAWARLRESRVSPLKPIAAWLAVELAIKADTQPDTKSEFKLVQAAKLVHRMSSGSHKRWERVRPSGQVLVEELHKYPHSRGQVLRHVGKQLGDAADMVSAYHLAEILDTLTAA
ncbi:MAG: hypothetical protein A2580_07505 [Hydrogenophilales bacterium RIFOXYD1_FULL_62_11]|nr:MAG: hypothetical protein A2580_07505 [Hydrogenophilales bacterium RIFOXYD1_FULL_62_11]